MGKCKPRRLLLLNDLLVCVSVNNKDDSNNTTQKRLTFKWSFPIAEIQVCFSYLNFILVSLNIIKVFYVYFIGN